MSANRVIVDLRRHRTGVPYIVGLISQYVGGLGGATVEWLLRPDQAPFVTQDRLGSAEAADDAWGERICQHMLDLKSTKGVEGPFWVLSFDNALLSKVKAVADHGIIVTAVHLGVLMSSTLLKQQLRERSSGTLTTAPVNDLTVEEASEMVRTLLSSGGHTSAERAFSQKELRPKLVLLDRRALKQPGRTASEHLIKNIVAKGQSEGWLKSFRLRPEKSGTEAVYLTTQTAASTQSAAPAAQPPTPLGSEESDALYKHRASEFEEHLALARIGAIPRTRDLLFDAIEAVVNKDTYEPLLLNDLLDVSMSGAKERAAEVLYAQEKNWEIAGRCTLRLMCRAGALLNQTGLVIADRIGRDSHRVRSLVPDFRLICEAYLAEYIIQSTPRFDYDDDTYYLGITLYRQGSSAKLSPSEIKEKADGLLSYLEQNGKLEMCDDRRIRCLRPGVPFKPSAGLSGRAIVGGHPTSSL